MSHYAVLVLHKANQNIDDMLAPYSENLEVEPYKEYTKQEALDYIKKEYVPYNDFMKNYSDDELINWFVNQYGSYSIGKDGNIYSTYNPNSKWDWYQIGGRFDGELHLTDEALLEGIKEYKDHHKYEVPKEDYELYRTVNSAPIKDIQWITHLSDDEKEKYRRWWAINVEGEEPEDGEAKDDHFFWNPEWYKQRYRDAETYIRTIELPCYHAVVTPDGEWHEESRMLFFACTDGSPEDELEWDLNFYDTFLKNENSNYIATIVDCHI